MAGFFLLDITLTNGVLVLVLFPNTQHFPFKGLNNPTGFHPQVKRYPSCPLGDDLLFRFPPHSGLKPCPPETGLASRSNSQTICANTANSLQWRKTAGPQRANQGAGGAAFLKTRVDHKARFYFYLLWRPHEFKKKNNRNSALLTRLREESEMKHL